MGAVRCASRESNAGPVEMTESLIDSRMATTDFTTKPLALCACVIAWGGNGGLRSPLLRDGSPHDGLNACR